MSCATCIKVDCAETSSLPKYLGGYSLSNGTFAQNAQPITVTTTNQSGPTTITFPPGSIQLSIPTPVPTSPFTFIAVMKQCQASFTIQIPPTQSAVFFDEVIAALAQQLGDCLNSSATPGGGSIHQYVNSPQTISCPGGSQMLLCNPSLSFPQGITFNSSGSGSLSIIGGVVVATTLASANAGAIQLLQSFLTNMLNSQNMACGGPCPPSCATALSSLNWTITPTNIGGGTGSGSVALGSFGTNLNFEVSASAASASGQVVFTSTITNTTNNDCIYNVSLSQSTTFSTCTDVGGDVGAGGVLFTDSNGDFIEYGFSNSIIDENLFPGTITIPANSSIDLNLQVQVNNTPTCSAPVGITGTVTISPA